MYVPNERRLILFGGTGDENLNDVWLLSFPAPVQTSVESVESPSLPNTSDLDQSYPSPFNRSVLIPFQVSGSPRVAVGDAVDVHLSIHDVLGRHVRDLVRDRRLRPGYHQTRWNGEDDAGRPVASGVYLYRLNTSAGVFTKKLLLAR